MPSSRTATYTKANALDNFDTLSAPGDLDWERRRNSGVAPSSASQYESLNAFTNGRATAFSSRSGPRSPALNSDNILFRLRSNSGLSLHTNGSFLRQYTDYNQDGSSVRTSHFEPVDWRGDGLDSIAEPSPSAGYRGSMGLLSNTSTTMLGSTASVPDFFSREVFKEVLNDPVTSHQLWEFAQSRGCGENMEFLMKASFESDGH